METTLKYFGRKTNILKECLLNHVSNKEKKA